MFCYRVITSPAAAVQGTPSCLVRVLSSCHKRELRKCYRSKIILKTHFFRDSNKIQINIRGKHNITYIINVNSKTPIFLIIKKLFKNLFVY